MAKNIRKILGDVIKFTITLGIATFLLWYVYKDFSFDTLVERFLEIKFSWLLVSIIVALCSHYLRAYRWNLLLEPLGYNLKTPRTFIAVMVGYFANNLVPRLGEVTRCGVLKRNDDVAMTSSLGSVVAERAFDLLVLIVIIIFTLFFEFDKLNAFILENFGDKIPDTNSLVNLIITITLGGIGLVIIAFILFKLLKNKFHRNPLYIKIRVLLKELLDGFLSIRKLKNKTGFWLSTFGIWFLYYLIPFVVFYAMPATSDLDVYAGLSILVMSGLGMSAPVQGGIGVFHILVSRILVLYGLELKDGEVFALVLHSTHFLTVMVFGGISFIISLMLKKK